MEGILWYVLTGTRGGTNRVRILRALEEQPWNANRLAERLDLDYKTVRYHLDVLVKNEIVDYDDEGYGSMYSPSSNLHQYQETVNSIFAHAEG
ncbi:DNA-binding protein [Haloprofundus marisrubri]|uniref:DNA-binding protein n=1 Tax=Haloprofundus marisrubri TaxID=1514971 RepID=A0A0W1RCH7_9EURY|nr:winged helix-turn-helix domain-containing protein [Haloprofundus marisrubri]KTG11171.1 DNA-binding protein [Haloprofundus marisrubri]